ncbi:MAG: WYL domain-containing protein [bacterium]
MPGTIVFNKQELFQIGLLCRVGIESVSVIDDGMVNGIWEKIASVLDDGAKAEIEDLLHTHLERCRNWDDDENDVDPAVYDAVEKAISIGKRLRIRYFAHTSGETTERIIHPYEIDENPSGPFLHAFCELRGEDRVFRLDAIEKILEVLPLKKSRGRSK